MPNISVLKSSKFLTKEDVGQGVLLTIKDCVEINVAKEGAPEEPKWCLLFLETEKPCVLNSTNGQIIAGFIGNDDTDFWKSHKVVLYNDPSITFQGKLTGGIRARMPKVKQPATPPSAMPAAPQQPPPVAGQPPAPAWPTTPAHAPAPALPPAVDDDIPF